MNCDNCSKHLEELDRPTTRVTHLFSLSSTICYSSTRAVQKYCEIPTARPIDLRRNFDRQRFEMCLIDSHFSWSSIHFISGGVSSAAVVNEVLTVLSRFSIANLLAYCKGGIE